MCYLYVAGRVMDIHESFPACPWNRLKMTSSAFKPVFWNPGIVKHFFLNLCIIICIKSLFFSLIPDHDKPGLHEERQTESDKNSSCFVYNSYQYLSVDQQRQKLPIFKVNCHICWIFIQNFHFRFFGINDLQLYFRAEIIFFIYWKLHRQL